MSVADIIKSGPDIPLSGFEFIMSFNDLIRSALDFPRSMVDFYPAFGRCVKKQDRKEKAEG
jgi:hypothetical protein